MNSSSPNPNQHNPMDPKALQAILEANSRAEATKTGGKALAFVIMLVWLSQSLLPYISQWLLIIYK